MKALFLYGMKCQPWIWDGVLNLSEGIQIEVVEYPRETTRDANSSEDIAKWISQKYLKPDNFYDVLVGHSMGGVLALQIANQHMHQISKVILVETFVVPSGDFYHNLLFDAAEGSLQQRIEDMLAVEGEYYSETLHKELRTKNYLDLAMSLIDRTAFIYGDRGRRNQRKNIDDLYLPSAISQTTPIKFVGKACHFPMLENELEFKSELSSLVKL
ncbi:MAG: alpha/beta hydrolase [Anaerolineaceae bacterium]|nr:alpha/beta hydrolase [Anaerolineaceae bacterium]